MAAIENEKIYGLKIRESANDGSDFPNPDVDYRLAFIGEDGLWHVKDSAGAVTSPSAAVAGSFVGAIVSRTAAQSVTNGAYPVALSFTAADTIDTDAFHDPSVNADRVTVPAGKAGKYHVDVTVSFAASATGERLIYLLKNGVEVRTLMRVMPSVTGNVSVLSSGITLVLAVGDYLGLGVYQGSGGALDVTGFMEVEFRGT